MTMRPSALTKLFRTSVPREVARLPDRALRVVDSRTKLRGLRAPRLPRWMRRYAAPLLVIVLPTLLTGIYYLGLASDQYATEARFMIRGQQSSTSSLFGALLSSASIQTSQEDLLSIGDYMQSHDALKTLQQRINISDLFTRDEADFMSRMRTDFLDWLRGRPITSEDFLDFYNGRVSVAFDSLTGISTLRVRAFRPRDTQVIADELLKLAEEKVNQYSARQRTDTLKVARDEVVRAEGRVEAARAEITQFRDREKSIDPGKSSVIIMEVIGKLEGQLAQARAEITEASTYLKADNAKFVALRTKADAIESQIKSEKQRLAGSSDALAPLVAQYERLMLEREFADKGYASAMTSQESARAEAMKQHFYLVRVIEPNLPEKPQFPRRFLTVMTTFVALCFTYGIGWLILAGIREHAA
jgi:capsular polysaccharide transport system permease protein